MRMRSRSSRSPLAARPVAGPVAARIVVITALAGAASLVAALVLPGLSAPAGAEAAGAGAAAPGGRIFEIRTYTTNPGKLEALHARFRNHTNAIFVRHGMSLIAYWTPVDRDDQLVYMLAYPSREARDKAWKAFLDDPEWKKAYADSIRDGRLVRKVESRFLRATDYSPIQ